MILSCFQPSCQSNDPKLWVLPCTYPRQHHKEKSQPDFTASCLPEQGMLRRSLRYWRSALLLGRWTVRTQFESFKVLSSVHSHMVRAERFSGLGGRHIPLSFCLSAPGELLCHRVKGRFKPVPSYKALNSNRYYYHHTSSSLPPRRAIASSVPCEMAHLGQTSSTTRQDDIKICHRNPFFKWHY